jgi:NAD-dependent dihydropyrimidine dehydrogenase PreA subunit
MTMKGAGVMTVESAPNAPEQRSVRTVKEKRRDTGAWITIEPNLCKECGLCVEACPMNVLRISKTLNEMGYHPAEYVGEGCTGCGVCFYVCPEPGTLTVHKPAKVRQKH